MGCDIHFYTDKRINGTWTPADAFKRDEPDEDNPKGYLRTEKEFYDGRNYDLFAILADVRNGRGFAGCKTGGGFNPIADPRGVPADATAEYRQLVEQWGGDGHSHSHLTLRELLDYDWTQTAEKSGWCNFVEWAKWCDWARSHGEGPKSYCGGVGGPKVQHINATEMDALVKDYRDRNGAERDLFAKQHESTYALATWTEDCATAARNFWVETIPKLLAVAGGTKGLDDVRICFFFDN